MDDSASYRRRDNAAPANGNRSHDDIQRLCRDGNDLGMTTSHRSISPAAVAVNRSPEAPRERARKHHHSKPPSPRPARGRSVEPSQPSSRHRRHDRARSPEDRSNRSAHPSHRSPRSRRDRSRDTVRRRESRRSPPRHPPDSAPPRPRRDSRRDSEATTRRRASRSPAPSKRRRSPSPSFGSQPQPKNPRLDVSPGRPEKGVPPKSLHSKPPRGPSPAPSRARSPAPRDRRSKPSSRLGRSRSPSPHRRRRSRSRSPRDRRAPPPQPKDGPRRRSRSPRPRYRSPPPDSRRRSRSRRRSPRSPPAWGSRPPTASDTGSHRRPSPEPGSSRAPHGVFPPRSPQGSRHAKSNKGRGRDESQSNKFDPTSGANSIEVNMAARGSYRGGFNPQMQSGYPAKGQYDARGYGQSSGHGTPASSFHGSPSAQSPYGGNGRGWNNQQQFSPQGSQYPAAPYAHNNYGPPTGPQGHYHSGQAHSPPYAPTGPASQYPSGPYRGNHRGGPGGFRGGQFSARGGARGGFKSTQWHPQSGNGRGQGGQGDESEPPHAAPHQSPSSHPDPAPAQGDVPMEDSDNPFRPSKDLQVEDTGREGQPKEDKMPPPSRPPPTGPQSQTSNKFSFSMKHAAKPAVAAPRPEISSKFNAAPPPREPPTKPSQKAPPTRPERDRGGAPRNAPTEPASARSRPNAPTGPSDRRPPEPSRHPDPTPRTRKVKKIVKRLKEKPTLPSDMAGSKSVFFRKPGNESVVGSGTYGKVFKGLNVYTKKLVALKKIRMEGERDGFPVTAVREVKLLSSLSHKNIVKLQEVMVETNECFMVFEYLSHDLTGLLNHPTYTLEPGHKKHLAQQLFEGLDYLHTRGVLHRDIKAANILVSSEGILKLADFGLARFYAKHHQLDYTNRVITIWYRSPELLLGETQYGPAVDIWSAACVLVEIFTKRAIFPGDGSEINQLEKIYSVLGTPTRTDWPNLVEMPWFALLRPGYRKPNLFEEKYKELLTPAAYDLLVSMFHYDPAKRPTAAEVLQHPYFTTEEPAARQAIELKDIGGEWHELESKALRREKERKEKERARAAQQQQSGSKEDAPETGSARDRERKRPNEGGGDAQRDAKRPHIDASGSKPREQGNHAGLSTNRVKR